MEVEREAAAGSDGEDGAEAGIDDYTPVSYNYTFFHGIYCLASMYFAMLMTGWASSEDMDENKIDVGVTSMWMKIASQWAMSHSGLSSNEQKCKWIPLQSSTTSVGTKTRRSSNRPRR